MSVATHLEGTASGLVLSTVEKDSVRRSISTLSDRLGYHFGSDVKEKIQFGSSTRDTILPRSADAESDIDYMVVFDNSSGHKPQTFIEWLRRFANDRYSSSEIYRSHPTVVLNLNHIMFELVPAYRSYGTLYIPAPSASFLEWISTDPNGFNARLEEKNKNNGYKTKPLIRLLKYWNAQNGYVYDSFSFEQWVVSQWFAATSLKEYFFAAVEALPITYDMAQGRKDKVERARRIVQATKQYERDNMPATAEAEIKKLVPPL